MIVIETVKSWFLSILYLCDSWQAWDERGIMKAQCVIVQIPCLNEAGTLRSTLDSLGAVENPGGSVQLLLINDGSTDSTVDVAIAARVDRVVSHTRNRGLAAAFTTGLDECLRMGADIIVNTDGDGQYPASEIPRLL
ncbi:MAG: glycosyltransferase family 2 protein, partial [Planctomycetaceae bacterium]|nr:glycosyltransferase family 2 protein [Planctomycetaceae bacterium]